VATDTGGADVLLVAALAGVAGATAGAVWDDFSEQATRKILLITDSKTRAVFIWNVLTWRRLNVEPS
jgi:hypothetical protein